MNSQNKKAEDYGVNLTAVETEVSEITSGKVRVRNYEGGQTGKESD